MPTIYEAPRLSPNATVTQSQVTGLTSALAAKANLQGDNNFIDSDGQALVTIAQSTRTLSVCNSTGVAQVTINGSTGIITGVGSGLTALNGSNISTGTVANARTTATNSNTASAIVARDGSGGFVAGTIQATFSGSTYTSPSNDTTITFQSRSFTGANVAVNVATGSWSNSSTVGTGLRVAPTDATTGTGGLTAFAVDMLGTGSGSGSKRLLDLRTAGTTQFFVTSLGNVVCGSAALSTSATNGFFYIDTCNGTPSGVPTTNTGTCACVYDTSANKLWIYNGAWRSVTLA